MTGRWKYMKQKSNKLKAFQEEPKLCKKKYNLIVPFNTLPSY